MASKVASLTLEYAQAYLDQGFRPFPLSPRSKIPLKGFELKKYQTEAPTDADMVKWFASGKNNVGLLLGRGVIAVDLDGEGAEEALQAAGVTLPDMAPRSRTAGGFHVLLEANTGDRVNLLKSTARDAAGALLKPLIDIRGVGYIVAPPSIHPSGHVYEWDIRPIGLDEIPKAPESLLTLIKNGPVPLPGQAATPSKAPEWVSTALKGVGEGQRDATCARLAGYFLGKGIPADIVRTQLYSFGAGCTPPFSRADVDKTVASMSRKDAAGQAAAVTAHAAEFQILGYNQGGYFYLPRGSRQVVELRAEQHSKLQLLRLAPLNFWEHEYANKKGVDWDMAANALIRKCEAVGVYDTSRIRGRGAWWDTDHAVLHLGDQLVTAGRALPIMDVPAGRYIYEAAAPMPITFTDPLDSGSAHSVVEIAELFNWERPISARLLSGWCAVAPICGALPWRPHVWVTGPAGSGKSWVMDRFIRPLLGDVGLAVQSETTEAGLRQTVGHDARPVVFDEAEGGDDQRGQQRIQNILALARQASSESGAAIVKGSPLGIAKTFRFRCCMAFSSIGVGVDKHADATRVSVLSIEKRSDPVRFARLQTMVADTLTEDYVRRFIARSIRLAPVIRENARVFSTAGAAVIGSQRLGDQVGVLLAGCYSLFADDVISASAAHEWVEEQDWSEQKGVQDETDESACLRRILEHVTHVQARTYSGQRSIGELIKIASEASGDNINASEANAFLWRNGIRVDFGTFTISNNHTAIAEILRNTSWLRGWARVLRRIPQAEPTAGTVRFGAGRGRGTMIPMGALG